MEFNLFWKYFSFDCFFNDLNHSKIAIFVLACSFYVFGKYFIPIMRGFPWKSIPLFPSYFYIGITFVLLSCLINVINAVFCVLFCFMTGLILSMSSEIKKTLIKEDNVNEKLGLLACLVTILSLSMLVSGFLGSIDFTKFSVKQNEFSEEQTELLARQLESIKISSISQLSKECDWDNLYGGKFSSYSQLKSMVTRPVDMNMSGNVRMHLFSNIREIEELYQGNDFSNFIENLLSKNTLDGKSIINPYYKVPSIADSLKDIKSRDWKTRIKGAYFLGKVTNDQLKNEGREWEDIFDGLRHVFNGSECSLSVEKVALDSYSYLTGLKSDNVLDYVAVNKDWNEHGSNILLRLKSQK